jgi:uncharacterized SAM-binding protein YcdF (DUF218 family)
MPVPGAPPDRASGLLRLARLLGAAAVALLAAGAFTPLANWLNGALGGPGRLEPADAIVVLGRGGADTDGVLTNRSLRRALHGVELYQRGLAPLLVFSGSPGEVEARGGLARALGVPAGALALGVEARTTQDEAARAAALLGPRGVKRVLLVADPVDMPRGRRLFARAGFTVLPAPTAATGPSGPEARLNLLREIAVEAAGSSYYWLLGRL